MARIILKTNLANKNVSVPTVNVNAILNKTPKPAELTITPGKSYKIDARNMSYGSLPHEIKSITFSNSTGGRVKAIVYFNTFTSKQPYISIYLPLSVTTQLLSNSFTLTENVSIDSNVLTEDTNQLTRASVSKEGNVYTVSGSPGSTVSVFNKTFSLPNNYYFAKSPSYNITGNKGRYIVKTSETTDSKGRTVSKTFNVKYKFPDNQLSTVINNSISFTAKSKEDVSLLKDQPVTSKEEGKIYSVNVSKKLGLAGGIKTISIKGIPGTHFKVLAQDGDGAAYNFKTSGVVDGGFLEGVIPAARKGFAYGEFLKSLKIPSSSTATGFDVRLATDAPIDHVKLAKYLVDKSQPREGVIETTEVISINPILTIALKDGGPVDTSATPDGHPGIFKIYRPVISGESMASTPITQGGNEYLANGTYAIGKGTYEKSISSFMETNPINLKSGADIIGYSFLIQADGDRNFIQINRAPKFAKSGYARWDFTTYVGYSGEYTKTYQVDGTEILSDWGTSIRHTVTSDTSDGTDIDFITNDWKINDVKVSVEGFDSVGDSSGPSDTLMYSYVILTIADIEGSFGKDDLTMELNLKNFLSTITI